MKNIYIIITQTIILLIIKWDIVEIWLIMENENKICYKKNVIF